MDRTQDFVAAASMSEGAPRGGGLAPGLPPGWQAGCTDEGQTYYTNPAVGTTWTLPVWLPEGWVQAVDQSTGNSWCASCLCVVFICTHLLLMCVTRRTL